MAWRYDNCGGGYDTADSGHGVAETHRVCVERRKGNTIAQPRSANIRRGLVGGI